MTFLSPKQKLYIITYNKHISLAQTELLSGSSQGTSFIDYVLNVHSSYIQSCAQTNLRHDLAMEILIVLFFTYEYDTFVVYNMDKKLVLMESSVVIEYIV